MNERLKRFTVLSAVLAFLFCFLGGIMAMKLPDLLFGTDWDSFMPGVGLYFIGKSFFVLAALIVMASNTRANA